jgi:hypothetical protein
VNYLFGDELHDSLTPNEKCDHNSTQKVIVTHGLALRLFLMRWFQFSVHDFEESYNPDNCELVTMTKMRDSEGHAWLELEEKNRLSLRLPDTVPRNVRLHRLQGLYDKDCGK